MSRNRSTDWNFPSWEQEQEMKRNAEIQARAFKEQMDKARYEAECAARKEARNARNECPGNPRNNPIWKAVRATPGYEEKYEATLQKAQELDAKGGTVNGIISAILKTICIK